MNKMMLNTVIYINPEWNFSSSSLLPHLISWADTQSPVAMCKNVIGTS